MKKRITRTIAYVLAAGMITGSIVPNNCSLAKENNVVSGIEEKENKEAGWNLKAVEVDEVTKQDTVSLKKIKIAVLDSGVDYSENVNVVERKDFLGEDISPLFEDGTGHGTAVAAVIGSNGENDTMLSGEQKEQVY